MGEVSEPIYVDPVCGMKVEGKSPWVFAYGGKTYRFCCARCKERFEREPERYLRPGALAKERPLAQSKVHLCPMHPEVRQEGPGVCPKCAMALEPEISGKEGLDESAEYKEMRRRLFFSASFTIPLVLVATVMGPSPFQRFFQLGLATPVCLWAAWPFYKRALSSLRSPNMFTLISLGVVAAYSYSLVATFFPSVFPDSFRINGQVPVYFESAAMIVTLVFFGQVLELRARQKTGEALRLLVGMRPTKARRISRSGAEEDVPIETIEVGDLIRVRPGEGVAVDGVVVEGRGAIDESMISGEPFPVEKGKGDNVVAGTILKDGALIIRAEKVGEETLLSRIIEAVAKAQRSRARVQRLADKVASIFVPAVGLVALVTFATWAILGALPNAIVNAVSVLIIACPCALGLATPVSIVVAVGKGALHGLLFRDADAIEGMAKVDTLVVDKTGTLTKGRPKISLVEVASDFDEDTLLSLALGLERATSHPFAEALFEYGRSRGIRPFEINNFEVLGGQGLRCSWAGQEVLLGNLRMMRNFGIEVRDFSLLAEELLNEGHSVLLLALSGRAVGLIAFQDQIREEAVEAVKGIREEGIRIVMVTGDSERPARAVATALGIEEVIAGALPTEKATIIEKLQQEGRIVAMAGDGINDAMALAKANVGIAMGTGTDIAIESAHLTLLKGDLLGILRARRLSTKTIANIRQNLFFAFLYNVLAVPVAAGALYPAFGVLLSPVVAALAMSLSSLSVVLNALRLYRVQV